MKKQKQFVIVGIMLVILATVSLSGCFDEKSKFIGTWATSDGNGTMKFTEDNKVTATGQFGDFSLSGTYTWAIADGKITFTSGSGGTLGVTYDYRFSDNHLIFTNSNGGSITLIKA